MELVAQQSENVSQRFKDVDSAGLPTKICHLKAEAAGEQCSTMYKIATIRRNILC